MAKFIFVRDREGIGYYVNVDLVQAVEEIPDSKRCRVWFGIEDHVTIDAPAMEVASLVNE
jgi:hypothetical protein